MRDAIRVGALLLAVAAAGCASTTYNPSTIEAVGALDRAQTQARNGLEVRATVLSPEETKQLFRADLADKHIQPVWLDIRNDTGHPVPYDKVVYLEWEQPPQRALPVGPATAGR